MATITKARPLHVIAKEIKDNWKNVYFGAKPYLNAMSQMRSSDDSFGQDDPRHIINYFLANAVTWKGDVARRVKKELNSMVKR